MTDEPHAISPPARVALRDVARAADVSLSTASDALNGKGRVDPATRAQIVEIAERLGYRANRAARHLRRGSTGVLAFTHDVPTDSPVQLAGIDYFVGILTAAAEAAVDHGYALTLVPVTPASTHDQLHVDGALVVDPEGGSPRLARLARLGVPTVTVGRGLGRPHDDGWWVDNDLAGATARMLDHLAERGADTVALLTAAPTRSYLVDALGAYERWTAGRAQPPRVVQVDGPGSESSAFEATLALLQGPNPPDAIYAPLDRLAVGAQLAARAAGRRVPDDLLVAAGSDSEATRGASPPVTALALHPDRLGRAAVELLVERLRAGTDAPPRTVVVDSAIEARASTARSR